MDPRNLHARPGNLSRVACIGHARKLAADPRLSGRKALALLVLLIFSGCHAERSHQQQSEQQAAVKVRVTTALQGGHSQVYRLPGTVRAVKIVPLASKLTGTILEVRVHSGDRVKAGQVLAVIDSREAEAMVQKAEAGKREAEMALQETESQIAVGQSNLELSEATLKRYEKLKEAKSVTPQEFEEVQARQRAAVNSVAALQARKQQVLARIKQSDSENRSTQALHSYAELRAPFSGVVTQKHLDVGSLALPGSPVVTVEEMGRYRLEVPVEESRSSALRIGQKLEVHVPGASEAPMQGVVREVEPSSDSASRTYLVKIELPVQSRLRSGMYGEAFVAGGVSEGVWIEKRGIVRLGQIEGVYVVERDNVARLRLMMLGATSGNQVEVLSGLQSGETYAVEPTSELKDGIRVEVAR